MCVCVCACVRACVCVCVCVFGKRSWKDKVGCRVCSIAVVTIDLSCACMYSSSPSYYAAPCRRGYPPVWLHRLSIRLSLCPLTRLFVELVVPPPVRWGIGQRATCPPPPCRPAFPTLSTWNWIRCPRRSQRPKCCYSRFLVAFVSAL